MKSLRLGPFFIISTCSGVRDALPRERRREDRILSSYEQDTQVGEDSSTRGSDLQK